MSQPITRPANPQTNYHTVNLPTTTQSIRQPDRLAAEASSQTKPSQCSTKVSNEAWI